MKDKFKFENKDLFRLMIYFLIIIMFVIKMNFYEEHFGNFNDELAHISYVVYLEEDHSFVPEFNNMKLLEGCDLNGGTSECKFNDYVNWLGHPPMYYWVMNLMGGISKSGDGYSVDLDRMRFNSQMLAVLGLAIAFAIGFTRIKSVIGTLVYALALTSVPMYSVVSAGVNNDTMSYIVVLIFFLGVLRFCENKRGYLTFALIGLGITLAGLTKLTTFMVIIFAAVIIVVWTLIKEKSFKPVFNKYFFTSLVIYIPVVVYYLIMLSRYGNVQFDAEKAGFILSFTPVEDRTIKGDFAYVMQYFRMYFITWCNVSNHYTIVKAESFLSMKNLGLMIIFFLPFVVVFSKSNFKKLPFVSIMIAYALTMVANFKNCYDSYMTRGYFGGMHSRYYYCLLPVFMLIMAEKCELIGDDNMLLKYVSKEKLKLIINVFFVVVCALLIYDDFLAFLQINSLYH